MKPPQIRFVKGYNSQEPPDMLQEAIEQFLLTKAALDDDTKTFYRKALAGYRRVSPEWPPTLATVVRFINFYQDNYQASTTHSYYTVVRMFVAYLVKRRLIECNPLEDLSPPPAPDDLPRAPAPEILKKFFNHLEAEVERILYPGNSGRRKYDFYGWREIRDLAFFSLLLDTGLRLNEACGVLVEDVDLKEQSVFVRTAKRKRQRFVAIGKRTRGDLKLWLGVRKAIELPDEPAYLFLRRYRGWGRVVPTGMEEMLQQYCVTLAIEPRFTPHALRHAYVDNALKMGGDLREIQVQMGHLNLRTTLRYAKGVSSRRLQHHLETSPRDKLF
jgi:site-specific recombinase XerD